MNVRIYQIDMDKDTKSVKFNKKIEQESPDFSQERNALFLFSASYLVYWFLIYCSTTSLLMFPRVLM